MIKVGIIGTGGMAKNHAIAFKGIRGVELAACLDVVPGRAEAFAELHGIPLATNDRDELFAAVDAVSIVTPDRHHMVPTLAALNAGKHVLCEKPLTVTLDEARLVAAAAGERPGLISMVNLSYRRSAAMQEAAKLVASGRLGDLRHVHAHYLQTWLSSDVWGGWTSEAFLWRVKKAAGSGGVLADIGVHIIDLTTAVAGEPGRVRCDLRTFPKVHGGARHTEWAGEALDANDSALIQLEFAGGALGVVQTTRWATGHRNHLRVSVHGTHGGLRFDLDESEEKLQVCLDGDILQSAWKTLDFPPAPTVWQRFIRAIETGERDQPDMARGAWVQAALEACLRSAESGAWEPIPAL